MSTTPLTLEQVAGTADEVDFDAADARVKPAPSPSSSPSDVRVPGTTVDVHSSSTGSSSISAYGAGLAEDDLLSDSLSAGVPFTEKPVDVDAVLREGLEETESLEDGQDGEEDESSLRVIQDDQEDDNRGSQSPARTILELPPAFDLSDGSEVDHIRDGEHSTDARLVSEHDAVLLQARDAGDSATDSSFLEDVPLTSFDTVEALSSGIQSGHAASTGLTIDTPDAQLEYNGVRQLGPARGQYAFRAAKRPPVMEHDMVYPPSPAQEQASKSLVGEGQQQAGPAQGQGRADNQPGEAGPPPPPPPPPKPPIFAYHHDDTDSTEKELEEFFSYVEVQSIVGDGRYAWGRGWEDPALNNPEWPTAPLSRKKAHIYHLIEELEHREPESRHEAARRIAYIAHGTPLYSTSSQHHLHLVVANCNLLRESGMLTAAHEALKSAGGRWNVVSSMPDSDVPHYSGHQQNHYGPSLTPQERQDYLEEINGELAMHLSILYFMVETLRGDEGWADELSARIPSFSCPFKR